MRAVVAWQVHHACRAHACSVRHCKVAHTAGRAAASPPPSLPQVLQSLSARLEGEAGADTWDRLLLFFCRCAADAAMRAAQDGHRPRAYRPATYAALQRYPRDYRRLDKMAALLRGAAASSHGGVVGSVGGSAPVSALLGSLGVTDALWVGLAKKTFLETRGLAAVAVAFSRLYVLHAVALAIMTLWVSRGSLGVGQAAWKAGACEAAAACMPTCSETAARLQHDGLLRMRMTGPALQQAHSHRLADCLSSLMLMPPRCCCQRAPACTRLARRTWSLT